MTIVSENPTLWLSVGPSDPDNQAFDVDLYMSRGADSAYLFIGTMLADATHGRLTTALAKGDAVAGSWDHENSIVVEMDHGALVNADPDAVLNGANQALITDPTKDPVTHEVVGFQVAVDDGTKTFTISKMARGLQQSVIPTSHAIGSRFTLLEKPKLFEVPLEPGDLNKTVFFKALVQGQDNLDDAVAVAHVVSALNIKGFLVTGINGIKNQPLADDWTFVWNPINRAPNRKLFQQFGAINPDGTEIDIKDGSTVKRTIVIAPGTTTAVYTAGQQNADFGIEQTTVNIEVYTVNPDHGRIQLPGEGGPEAQDEFVAADFTDTS